MITQNVNNKRIYLSSPHMSDEGYEMQYIKEAFDTNWIAPLGPNVDGFEKELAAYVGIGHAAALSSGTAAMHMALKAAGVGEGDIVFCQSLTFSGTANPIIYQNAIPVFIDSNYETWNMDPKALQLAFKKYPQVKAVIVVHLYGLSADMDKIIELCKEHNVILIEDAAESLGTKYRGNILEQLVIMEYFHSMVIKSLPHQAEGCLYLIMKKELLKSDFGQHKQGTRQDTTNIVNWGTTTG